MQLDRTSARALVDAGYMPLSEYIAMFADEPTSEAAAVEGHPARQSTVPAHFASPTRPNNYRITYRNRQSAA